MKFITIEGSLIGVNKTNKHTRVLKNDRLYIIDEKKQDNTQKREAFLGKFETQSLKRK